MSARYPAVQLGISFTVTVVNGRRAGKRGKSRSADAVGGRGLCLCRMREGEKLPLIVVYDHCRALCSLVTLVHRRRGNGRRSRSPGSVGVVATMVGLKRHLVHRSKRRRAAAAPRRPRPPPGSAAASQRSPLRGQGSPGRGVAGGVSDRAALAGGACA